MCDTLARALKQEGMALDNLDLVVPHQANGRIIEAMRSRLRLPEQRVWNEIRCHGNTSSSSIPLALDTVLRRKGEGQHIGLCAFGGATPRAQRCCGELEPAMEFHDHSHAMQRAPRRFAAD